MSKLIVNVWARGVGYGPGFDDLQPPPGLVGEFDDDVWDTPPTVEPAAADGPVDGIDALRAEAEALGVTVNARWREKRLHEEIEKATAAANDLEWLQ